MTTERFIELLGRGDFEGAYRELGGRAAQILSAAGLSEGWSTATQGFGKLAGILEIQPEGKNGELVTVELTGGTLVMHLIREAGTLISVFLEPAREPYRAPPYCRAGTFTSRAITVNDAVGLPGTLVLPGDGGRAPIAVLVPGSGPRDRDDWAEDTRRRIFRDLAEGLACRGIASIRWDKRTRRFIPRGASFDIADEYLDDVSAAVALARSLSEVDHGRMFIVGHSMGGHLMPLLCERSPDVRGGVALAGPARSLVELLVAQVIHAMQHEGMPADEALQDQVRRIEDPDLRADTPTHLLWNNIPASYWLSLRGYDAVATARKLERPLLFVQGERDVHVTVDEDLRRWREGLGHRDDVRFVACPGLDHDLVVGEDQLRPTATLSEGSLDESVVREISDFISAIRGA